MGKESHPFWEFRVRRRRESAEKKEMDAREAFWYELQYTEHRACGSGVADA